MRNQKLKKVLTTALLTTTLAVTSFEITANALTTSTYTVKSHDTLYSIASKYKTTVDTLKKTNHLTSNSIRVGQKLKLPTQLVAAPQTSTEKTTTVTYTVQKGDTLSAIAKKFKTTVTSVKQLNNLKSDIIRVGQKLKVSTTQSSPVISPPVTSETITYTVKKGDTLFLIARNYKTTVANIKNLNNLKSDMIGVGQKLMIKQGDMLNPAPVPAPFPNKDVEKEVLGYTVKYSQNDTSSLGIMKSQYRDLTTIATASQVVDGSGNLHGNIPKDELSFASQNQIKPILMIGNEFDQQVAHTLLNDKNNRSNFIKNTLNILQTNGYKGVNIDIENVMASDRDAYTTLIKELSSSLKAKGYTLSVALQAKSSDNPRHTWNYAYDYKSIASYVDYVLIMTYDEHYSTSAPGSIASIGWVQNVIDYTLTVIPKEKILLGIGSYGYDWGDGLRATGITYETAMQRAKQYNAVIQFDNITKTPHYDYTDANGVQHHVWFENAESLSYKLDLVNSRGLKGIGIWRLGQIQDATYWNQIKSQL